MPPSNPKYDIEISGITLSTFTWQMYICVAVLTLFLSFYLAYHTHKNGKESSPFLAGIFFFLSAIFPVISTLCLLEIMIEVIPWSDIISESPFSDKGFNLIVNVAMAGLIVVFYFLLTGALCGTGISWIFGLKNKVRNKKK